MKKILIIGPLVCVLLCALFNIVAYASTGTVGGELYALNQKDLQLEEQNAKLVHELAQTRSLSVSDEKARTLGFVHVSALTQVTLKDTKVAMESQ
ncbi:MAG: hypothetical protein ABI758_06785 [Candidatus Woesebacteria bacterium]